MQVAAERDDMVFDVGRHVTRAPQLDPASPLPLWIGIGMALAAMLAAMLVLATFNLSDFPVIAQACALNGFNEAACTAGAWRVGWLAILAYAAVLAGGIALHRRIDHDKTVSGTHLPDTGVRLVLGVALAIVLVHLLAQVAGPAFASRSDESRQHGALISIENLLWPLLLQLYLSQSDARLRTATLATLLAVMALSPYRSALLAIMIFGFAVPLAAALWQTARAGWPRALVLGCAWQGALAIVIGAVVTWGGYVGTVTRFPSLLVVDQLLDAQARARMHPPVHIESAGTVAPQASAAARTDADLSRPAGTVTAPPPAALVPRLAQRVVFPLYQAAIVGQLATQAPLPSLWNELGRKFRLTEEPTLEEFLFRRIYGGASPDQTTSLYFGEAVAYFPGPPLVWMIAGPSLLMLAALLLRRWRIPAMTTLGVALWRSSFSGLATILPALVLQLATLGAMGTTNRRMIQPWMHRAAHLALTAVLAAVLVGQVWAIAVTPSRRALTISTYTVAPQCVLVSPTVVSIRADQALAAAGQSVRSSLAFAVGDTIAVTLPFGGRAEPAVFARVADRIATLVDCAQPKPAVRVTLSGVRHFSTPINPLDVLSAIGLALALAGGIRPSKAPRFATPR
jgi:hypothetical protein